MKEKEKERKREREKRTLDNSCFIPKRMHTSARDNLNNDLQANVNRFSVLCVYLL